MRDRTRRERILYYAALALAIGAGIFLRLPSPLFTDGAALHAAGFAHPTAKFSGIGFDEGLYREYVNALSKVGIGGYPDIVEAVHRGAKQAARFRASTGPFSLHLRGIPLAFLVW